MATTKKTEDESMAAQIASESEVPAKPSNSPALKPWAVLTRRQRADFQKTWSANMPADVLSEADGDVADIDLAKVGLGFVFSFLADVEDALALVAVAPALFREWAANASDEDLQDLFGWYQHTQASGE